LICDVHAYLGHHPAWAQLGLPLPFDAPRWVEMMDRTGVDRALVAPPGVGVGDDFKPDMDRIAIGMKDFPERLFGFCRVKPRRGQKAIDELRHRVEDQNFRAVKMNTLDDDYRLDDRRLLDPVIEAANDLGIVVFFHTGDQHGDTCQPSMVADIAADFPDTTFIIGHCGFIGYESQTVPALRAASNTVCETAGILTPSKIQAIVDEVGATRVLMGSNGPNTPIDLPHIMINKYMNKLTDEEKALITGGNFERILGLN
jgi:predicted TIM-barrel fold metal-dependent hydrolase